MRMFDDIVFTWDMEVLDFCGHLLLPRYEIYPSRDCASVFQDKVMLLSSIPVRVALKTVKGGKMFVRYVPDFALDLA
jgi:hypothetical protein